MVDQRSNRIRPARKPTADASERSSRGWRRQVPLTTFVACVALGFFIFGLGANAGQLSTGVTVAITATAAMGVQLLYLDGGVLSVAHSALMGVGAYAAAVVLDRYGIGFWPALAIAGVLGALGGGLFGGLLVRIKGFYFVIVTFAIAGIFGTILDNWNSVTGGVDGLIINSVQSVFGTDQISARQWYFLGYAMMAVAGVAIVLIRKTPLLDSVRAASQNEPLAASLGLSVARRRAVVVAISGIFPAVSGVFYAYYIQAVTSSDFSTQGGIVLILVAIVGGSIPVIGPILGSVLYYFVQAYLGFGAVENQAVLGAILIAIVLIAPEGVAGTGQRVLTYYRQHAVRSGHETNDSH